jgi:hypothetical protein
MKKCLPAGSVQGLPANQASPGEESLVTRGVDQETQEKNMVLAFAQQDLILKY